MATYYLDGSVSSSGGGGAGTINDPFVKNSDLLQYALTMVGFTVGRGADGDKFINLDGDLPQTAPLNFGGYGNPTSQQPFYVDGSGSAGDHRTTIDLNAKTFAAWSGSDYGLGFYGLDFVNLPPASAGTNACFQILGISSFINCSFDNSVNPNYSGQTIINAGYRNTIIDGCTFRNVNGRGGSTGNIINFTDAFGPIQITNCFFDLVNGFTTNAVTAPRMTLLNNVFKNVNPLRQTGSAIIQIKTDLYAANNTFYSADSDIAIKIPDQNSITYFRNNYFEGMSIAINNTTQESAIYNVSGNFGFNNLQAIQPASARTFIETGNSFNLTASGLTDATNNDFTPTAELINAGFNTSAATFPTIAAPTVGAIEAQGSSPPSGGFYAPQIGGTDNAGSTAEQVTGGAYIPRLRDCK